MRIEGVGFKFQRAGSSFRALGWRFQVRVLGLMFRDSRIGFIDEVALYLDESDSALQDGVLVCGLHWLHLRKGRGFRFGRIVKRFRGGLVFKARRLLYHSTLT